MKKNLHPKSQKTVFQDMMTGQSFLVESTVESGETVLWSDGKTYPLVKVEISSSSHPAFTGKDAPETKTTRRENFENKFNKRIDVH
jgi:large subunit ribosomal protein L31